MFRRVVLPALTVVMIGSAAYGVFLWMRFDARKDCRTVELAGYIAYFSPDSANLSPEALRVIDDLADSTKYHDPCVPVDRLTLVAHTDTVGEADANLNLAKARAKAVAARLKTKGVTLPIRIVLQGEANLPVPTADNVREPLNNRVELGYLS